MRFAVADVQRAGGIDDQAMRTRQLAGEWRRLRAVADLEHGFLGCLWFCLGLCSGGGAHRSGW